MVAIIAEEVALGHFVVENRLDILEFGAFGVVGDEAADAAFYTREVVGADHLGAFVAMVEMEGDGGLGGNGPGAFQTNATTELLGVDVLVFGVNDLGLALGFAIGHESGIAATVGCVARFL